MGIRNEVAPRPLSVELAEEGIYVLYDNDRRVFYNGVPGVVSDRLRCQPGKDVQVLVTDETGREGVMTYVNEMKTDDDVLEDSGVGRVLVEGEQTAEIYPGVTAEVDGMAIEIAADFDELEGRVFVFEEDEHGEAMYELRPEYDEDEE
ncbi:MAG: DUF5796 family protein [Halodesulfurarchaeum sp.]